jgi:hypothetical protein
MKRVREKNVLPVAAVAVAIAALVAAAVADFVAAAVAVVANAAAVVAVAGAGVVDAVIGVAKPTKPTLHFIRKSGVNFRALAQG